MSSYSQVKKTFASLKGLQSTIETFAIHEENKESQELLKGNAKRLDEVIGYFEDRLAILEYEEPQYKGF